MNILQSMRDPELFRPFLIDKNDSIRSWRNWMIALRCLYGMPLKREHHELVRACTGRDPRKMPPEGFASALFLTGRRSGKSRIASTIVAHEAALAGHEERLAPGELGIVPIIAPTKAQARVVWSYVKAIFQTPLLKSQIASSTRETLELKSGVRIEMLVADGARLRGYTSLCACVDEIAFMGSDAESRVRSDTELIRAIKPTLAKRAKLVCISSPNARAGWSFETYERNFGNDRGKTLVWCSPSRTMNGTLPQSVVDEAIAEDLESAKSEYLGQFREPVAAFVSRDIVDRCIVKGCKSRHPLPGVRYVAFCDLASGAAKDASALAIGHAEVHDDKTIVVLDRIEEYRGMTPVTAIREMATVMRSFGVDRVVGDRFGDSLTESEFARHGIAFFKANRSKNDLYSEFLPRLTSGRVKLLDRDTLIDQLCSLERRTRSGRAVIDHPKNGRDDLANVLAGLSSIAAVGVGQRISVGALSGESHDRDLSFFRENKVEFLTPHDLIDWGNIQ